MHNKPVRPVFFVNDDNTLDHLEFYIKKKILNNITKERNSI